MDLKTSTLISYIKLAGSFPEGMFADSDYIKFLNDGFFTDILPFVMKHREDYYVKYQDQAYSDSIEIPSDAVGAKLRDIVRVSSDGRMLGNIPRFTYEEMSSYSGGRHTGFYIEDNSVKFYPTGTINDTIRMYYFERPNLLTLESNCMELTSISGADASGTIPATWTTSTTIDVMDIDQPYNMTKTYSIDAVDVTAGTITLSASGFSSGDFVCPKGYSVVPRIPLELRDVLIQSAVLKALIALKDLNGAKMAKEEMFYAMDQASTLLTPRVDGETKKVVNNGGVWNYRYRNNRGRY